MAAISKTVLAGAALSAGLALATPATASELLWSTEWSNWTTVESVVWTSPTKNVEAADDFDVVGTVERVVVDGYNSCLTVCNPPPVLGVYVRFYTWTPSGPGSLQHEVFLPAGDSRFVYDPGSPATLDVTLPVPFATVGKHFLSVQLSFQGGFYWAFWVAGHGSPSGSHLWTRNNLGGGAWGQPNDVLGDPLNDDLYFSLYGCPAGGCASQPVVAGCGQWHDVPSPNPAGSTDARLESVDVVAPWDVWAVGSFTGPIAGSPTPRTQSLAMRWNGLTWSIVPTPSPSPNPSTTQVALAAVSATGTNDAWAVGYKYGQDAGGYVGPRVLAMRWNGFTWTDMNAPWPANNDGSVFTGASGEQFYDVAAIAPDDVWMVGRYWREYPSGAIWWPGVAMHWNGSGFESYELPMVSPSNNQVPAAIAVVSTDDIWVVGAGNGVTPNAYIWHWNGSTWSAVSAPSPGTYRSLSGVVALAPDDVWAGGFWRDPSYVSHPWLLHWNGTTWSEVASPAGGDVFAARAPDDILAAGLGGFAHWDGTSWTPEPAPEFIPWAGIKDMEYVSPCTLWGVGMKSTPSGYATYTVRLEPVNNPGGDTDGDGVPNASDNCPANFNPDQLDCDGDGAGNVCELIDGTAQDCNGNGSPDNCDTFEDCNGNEVPDECEVDCNGNGTPDTCDVAAGSSADCNTNGVPDECETFADCNTNGINDWCDIDGGSSTDGNANGFPDECEALGPDFATVTTPYDVVDFGGGQELGDLPGPDGLVSFREALMAANNTPGPQTVAFNVPPERWDTTLWDDRVILHLETGLFHVSDDATTLDFTTQTRFTGDTNPAGNEVGIYGFEPNAWGVTAIQISADDCTVKGLDQVLQRGYAVRISGNGNRVIGSTISGPWYAAVYITGAWEGPVASGNIIGGTTPEEGNSLSGAGDGVRIDGPAANNVVIGNAITGGASGVAIRGAVGNRIGGPTVAERNVISGAGNYDGEGCPGGEQIEISGANGNLIEGNYIGTTADGLASAGQAGTAGISLLDSSANLIRGNLIAGIRVAGFNHCSGSFYGTAVAVYGASTNNVIDGNRLGLDALGQNPIVNHAGVALGFFPGSGSPSSNLFRGNVIAHSELDGVNVGSQANGITITENSIHDNGLLGIRLAGGTGNGGQPAPVLTAVATDDVSVTVTGTIAGSPNRAFRVEFFANATCDPSGAGEGEVFLGSGSVTSDGTGSASFNLTLPAVVLGGQVVTATATDLSTGNTSAFSTCASASVVACTGAPREVAAVGIDADRATLSWSMFGPSVQYDVVRGALSGLRVLAPASCIATGLTGGTFVDSTLPGAGLVNYYMVRGTNACGAGPWGPSSFTTSCP